jgi:hypothetical protein
LGDLYLDLCREGEPGEFCGGAGHGVLVTPTNDFGEVLARMQGTRDPCFPSLFIC